MRMTIYVQDELRERMAPHDKDQNWSAVASRAFETVVLGGGPSDLPHNKRNNKEKNMDN